MTKYRYEAEFNQICTKDFHDGEEYGEWHQVYDNSFKKITPIGPAPDNHPWRDVDSTLNLDSGEKAFVVWAECSTGDSFGHGEGNDVQAFGIFKSEEAAKELEAAIYASAKDDRSSSFHCQTSDGQVFEGSYMPWQDYFGSLDVVHVEEVVIGKEY